MSDEQGSAAGDGFALEGLLVLQWRLAAPLTGSEAPLDETANLRVLHDVALLDDVLAPPVDESGPRGSGELLRIERKLDLALQLLESLLMSLSPTRAPVAVRLSTETLTWDARGSPVAAPHTALEVDLHLHPGYPMPLRLRGVVEAPSPGAGDGQVSLRLDALGGATREALHRFLFRRHRREVAARRRRERPDSDTGC